MNFRQQLRGARAWWVGIGLVLCCLTTSSSMPDGIVFALDSCLDPTTPCLNVSIANSISLDLKPISPTGTFAKSDAATNTVGVMTNYFAGYTLGIAASSTGADAANLIQTAGEGNEQTVVGRISSIGTVTGVTGAGITEQEFSNANNTQYNNTWGYKVTNLNTTTSTNYLPAPTNTTSISMDTTGVANASTANNYNIAIGARVDTEVPKGNYTNTFVVQVVANPIPYTITYNKNTEDTVANMPSNVNTTTIDTSVTVGSAPSRSGYNFVGWCTAAVVDGGTCDSPNTQYAAGGSYMIDQVGGGNNLTLYAVWKKPTLYEAVAAMSKGTQTNDDDSDTGIQAPITAPTSADRTEDTSNSGVYEYDSSEFGTASDASNTSKIYYYRGVLENSVGSYGSDGSAVTYPNYVVLSSASNKSGLTNKDTCWRIVRTTGSGGVKMIYNGKWTGSTCANAQANAQVRTSAFNGTSSTYRQMVRVGYTYNSTYATNTARSGTIAQIFGTNSTPSVNNTRSTIKQYIEDTWYAGNMTAYTSILEPSAGYCNDRTMNTTTNWTTPLTEDSTIAATYGTSVLQAYYFGAYVRNMDSAQKPSLTCAKYSNVDRSTVDLYRYNGTNNAAGSTTANYLKYPVALLTADEASFAGSGRSTATQGSAYNANSYLRSGNSFWLLSPYSRNSYGNAIEFGLTSDGYLNGNYVGNSQGVRPAISLTSGTSAVDGIGTATNPWIVNPPPSS